MDGEVITFDDVVTMRAPYSELEGFTGAVRGSLLLAWLNKQKGDSVKLTVDGTESRWSCGRSRLSLPVFPSEDFSFDLPDMTAKEGIASNESLTKALASAMRSLGLDPAHEWRLGITLEFDDEGCTIYSSDNATCARSWATVDYPTELSGRCVVLAPRFMELLKSDKAAPIEWVFDESQVGVRFPGDRWAYCRLLRGAKPRDHEGVFGNFEWDSGFSDVPAELDDVLDNCLLVHPDKAVATANLLLEGSQMRVEARTSMGEVEEVLPLEGATQTQAVAVAPTMLRRCIDGAKLFKVTDSAVQVKTDCADILCGVESVQ